ncbi:MAG: DUF1367 family protein [Candidatus Omnitrophota bacterium]|jgi:hypothetical protein
MIPLFLKKVNGQLCPASRYDEDQIARIREGETVHVELTKKRNLGFHRRFFALINYVFENQDKYKIVEDLLIEIKLKTGHYAEHVTLKGNVIYVPKSISFAQCDEIEFRTFYEKAIDICLNIIEGETKESLEKNVENVLNFI